MDLTWGRFLLVVGLVVAFELGVAALAARAEPKDDEEPAALTDAP
jgi:hypothetical protein